MRRHKVTIIGLLLAASVIAGCGQQSYVPVFVPAKQPLAWQPASFEGALALASRTKKPLMVDFYAGWCTACKQMDAHTYPDARVIDEARNFVAVRVDSDKRMDLTRKYDIESLPTILWLDGKGHVLDNAVGLYSPVEFTDAMRSARDKFTPQ